MQIGMTKRIRFTGVLGEVAVACCDLDITVKSDQPQVATLFSLYTLPPFRGMGWAKALIASALETAEAYGRPVVVLSVHCANTIAINLYEDLGFMPFGSEGGFHHYAHWRDISLEKPSSEFMRRVSSSLLPAPEQVVGLL